MKVYHLAKTLRKIVKAYHLVKKLRKICESLSPGQKIT